MAGHNSVLPDPKVSAVAMVSQDHEMISQEHHVQVCSYSYEHETWDHETSQGMADSLTGSQKTGLDTCCNGQTQEKSIGSTTFQC